MLLPPLTGSSEGIPGGNFLVYVGSTGTFPDVVLPDMLVEDGDNEDSGNDEFAQVLVRKDVNVGLTGAVELIER